MTEKQPQYGTISDLQRLRSQIYAARLEMVVLACMLEDQPGKMKEVKAFSEILSNWIDDITGDISIAGLNGMGSQDQRG